MKFTLKNAFQSILRWGELAHQKGDPVSMVLLVRESRFPTLDQLRSTGERAFGTPFTADKGSQHYVVQVALLTIMKAGPHTLSFLNQTRLYGDDPQEFENAWPSASQREAFIESTVHELVLNSRIGWWGLGTGMKAYHTFLLVKTDQDCHIITEEVVRGEGRSNSARSSRTQCTTGTIFG